MKPANTANLKRSRVTSEAIAVRFGDAILDAGHTAIPNLALETYAVLGLTPAEMLFVIHVWQHKWTARNPYPSLGSIAARMGLSRRQVRTYVQRLRDRGLLIVTERKAPGLGQVTSEYDFGPFLQPIRRVKDSGTPPGKDSSGGPGKDSSSEEDPAQEEPVQPSNGLRNGRAPAHARGEGNTPTRTPGTSAAADSELHPRRQPTAIARLIRTHPLAQMVPKAGSRSHASPTPPSEPRGGGALRRRTLYLDAVIADTSSELGDALHLFPNLAQAYRLWEASGVPEEQFVERVYMARSLTNERVRSGGPGLRNRGAYFFRVLRDLCERAPKRSSASTPLQDGQTAGANPASRLDGRDDDQNRDVGHPGVLQRAS